MDAPCDPALLRLIGRPRLRGGRIRDLGGRLGARPRAIDDGVPRDGVEPRRARAALGLVRGGRAPDRRERLLHRVLSAPAVAEAAEGEAEDGPGVAAIEI